jgi:hypothetical protein
MHTTDPIISAMSAREMKARDERKDTVALLLGATVVGTFLMGSLISWPIGAVAAVLGSLALANSLRS